MDPAMCVFLARASGFRAAPGSFLVIVVIVSVHARKQLHAPWGSAPILQTGRARAGSPAEAGFPLGAFLEKYSRGIFPNIPDEPMHVTLLLHITEQPRAPNRWTGTCRTCEIRPDRDPEPPQRVRRTVSG